MSRRAIQVVTLSLGAVFAAFINVSSTPAAADVTSCRSPREAPSALHDLNGDGRVDAVVGDPYATVEGQAEAGTVTVLFGSVNGRIGDGERRVLTQRDMGETPEPGDRFGWSVNMYVSGIEEICTGLMVGAPGEDVDGHDSAGSAHMYMMNSGPPEDPPHDAAATVVQSDVGGTVETGDEFGFSVAASRRGRDSGLDWPNFAFGAPGENDDAGVVNVLPGIADSGYELRQGAAGLPGRMEAGDRFGQVIQPLHYFPQYDDGTPLYIGAPGDVVDGKQRAGSVTVIDVPGGPMMITQNTSGVPGIAETGDHFGASMASGRSGSADPFQQLAIGAPGEDVGTTRNAGSVTVLKRTPDTIYPATKLTQATKGISGAVETGDRFGAAVAYRGDDILAIGVPGENLGHVVDAGSAQIVRVGKSKLSFPSPTITENSPATPGKVKARSRFGATVTGLPGNGGEAIFAISSPFQDGGSVYVISSDPTVGPRSWKPKTHTIPGTAARFGQSVA